MKYFPFLNLNDFYLFYFILLYYKFVPPISWFIFYIYMRFLEILHDLPHTLVSHEKKTKERWTGKQYIYSFLVENVVS